MVYYYYYYYYYYYDTSYLVLPPPAQYYPQVCTSLSLSPEVMCGGSHLQKTFQKGDTFFIITDTLIGLC